MRAGGSLPKQFCQIGGYPVLWWSLKAFHEFDEEMQKIIVLHPKFSEIWNEIFEKLPENKKISHNVVFGGETRFDSVYNGLKFISSQNENSDDSIVFIHDGARPLVTKKMLSDGISVTGRGRGVIPVSQLTDSIRRKEGETTISVPRKEYLSVQTPQIFMLHDISRAYQEGKKESKTFTDDASVAEKSNLEIAIYPGDPINIKITHPYDFVIAEALLKSR